MPDEPAQPNTAQVPAPAAPSVAPTTTKEEDRKTAGQRAVNIWWEFSQSILAFMIIGGFVYLSFQGKESSALGALAGSVSTFYFVRTNHTKIGGVGGTDSR